MIEKGGVGHAHISTGANPSNQTVLEANKSHHLKLLHALKTRAYAKKKIISFKEVGRVLSWWRIGREECKELLYDMQQAGYLKIVPYHGVIILV